MLGQPDELFELRIKKEEQLCKYYMGDISNIFDGATIISSENMISLRDYFNKYFKKEEF